MQTPDTAPRGRNPLALALWSRRERRPRALVRLLGFLLLFILASIVLGAVTIGALMAAGQAESIDPSSDALLLTGALTTLVASLAATWAAGRALDRRPLADFGLRLGPSWWLDLGFGLALGALLMAAIFAAELALGWVAITGTLRATPEGRPFALAILGPLVTFVCVGIYEELISRGYLLRNLAEGLRLPGLGDRGALALGWVLSSAVFGALHAGNPNATPVSTLTLVLAGLFLGLGYVLTGELAIPIGLHITWNFFQGSVFGFPVSGTTGQPTFIAIEQRGPELWTGGAFGPEAGLIGVLAILLGSLLTVLWVRARRGGARLHTRLAAYEP